jgi:hypothetical protein
VETKQDPSSRDWATGWRDGREAPTALALLHGLGAVAFLFAGLRLHTQWRKGERGASWALVAFGLMQVAALPLVLIGLAVSARGAQVPPPTVPVVRDQVVAQPSRATERDGFWAVGDCGNDIGGGQVGYNLIYQACNESDELRVVAVAALDANPLVACPTEATTYIQDADHGQLVCFVRVEP